MDDLVTWLRAQLGEDERVARATTEWQPYDQWDAVGATGDDDAALSNSEVVRITRPHATPAARSIAEHIARWDPARVLAEVDAKRRMLDLAVYLESSADPDATSGGSDLKKLLVLSYANHPGYREEWRPAEGR